MKKLTRIEDVGDFLFGSSADNNYWIAKFEDGKIMWHASDRRGKLRNVDYNNNEWNYWSTNLSDAIKTYVIKPLNKQEEGLSDVAYKIRILEQKFLNRKQHAVGYSG